MTTPGTPPLVFVTGCTCAGSGCGGHAGVNLPEPAVVVAQHTYTAGCDGLHPPGPCPAYEKPLEFAAPFQFGPACGCTNPDCPRRAQPDT